MTLGSQGAELGDLFMGQIEILSQKSVSCNSKTFFSKYLNLTFRPDLDGPLSKLSEVRLDDKRATDFGPLDMN